MSTGTVGSERPVDQSRRPQAAALRGAHMKRAWRALCGAVFAIGLVVAASDAGKATDDRTATLLAMAPTSELVEATVGNRLLSVIDESGKLNRELQTEIATYYYYHDNDDGDDDDETSSPTDPTKKKKKKKKSKKKKKKSKKKHSKKKHSKKKHGKKKFKKRLKKSSDDDD